MTDPRDPTSQDAAPAAPAEPSTLRARVEPASPELGDVGAESVLPGAHRGGFGRLPTEPVDIAIVTGPGLDDDEAHLEWAPIPAPPRRSIAGWALAFAVVGLAVSLVVGWGFPLGLVAIVVGIVAARRPLESTGMAAWAISLGGLSVLYSIGWLVFAGFEAGIFD